MTFWQTVLEKTKVVFSHGGGGQRPGPSGAGSEHTSCLWRGSPCPLQALTPAKGCLCPDRGPSVSPELGLLTRPSRQHSSENLLNQLGTRARGPPL